MIEAIITTLCAAAALGFVILLDMISDTNVPGTLGVALRYELTDWCESHESRLLAEAVLDTPYVSWSDTVCHTPTDLGTETIRQAGLVPRPIR